MIQLIAQQSGGSVRKVCQVLKLARSSFYHAATPTASQIADETMGDLIEALFRLHRRRYGYRRLAAELADRHVSCSPARIRRIMAQRALRALQPKSFVPRTSDGRADKPSPNLLTNQPPPSAPNQVWAGDLTYIPTHGGWLYLAVVIDLCSRRIVGWSLSRHLHAQLVVDALKQALLTRPAKDVVFHSDRGSQYSSTAFRNLLTSSGLRQSMSRRNSSITSRPTTIPTASIPPSITKPLPSSRLSSPPTNQPTGPKIGCTSSQDFQDYRISPSFAYRLSLSRLSVPPLRFVYPEIYFGNRSNSAVRQSGSRLAPKFRPGCSTPHPAPSPRATPTQRQNEPAKTTGRDREALSPRPSQIAYLS
ncbi:MAG: IS3 family transposase [Verrucomicrobia bacterium]|nr:IS3 family transposase [Verrucomicrobiota bacterium]